MINIYGISTLPSATTTPLIGSQNRLLKYLNQQTVIPATINIAAIRLSQVSTAHNSLLNAPSTASEDKDTDNISDVQEEEGVSFRKVEDYPDRKSVV